MLYLLPKGSKKVSFIKPIYLVNLGCEHGEIMKANMLNLIFSETYFPQNYCV
jgi:BioD-like phosphotransacetylase family protein